MILFIAPNPFKVNEREGYLQRVAAIDDLFSDHEKLYSHDFESDEKLAESVIKADLIYVHSMYRAEEIIDLYPVFGDKIITDLHGVVPEEEELIGETRRSGELSAVESIVFKHGTAFVAVTNAMVRHFKKKYKNIPNDPKWIVLPIFENVVQKRVQQSKDMVVYAGGAQRWQNIDLMVSAINKTNYNWHYTILTHDPEAFKAIEHSKAEKVVVKKVASNKVKDYYENAKLGFILRDDTTVNNVACPTKLIEYLSFGVVPIVLSPNIGDFKELGYKYITYTDFLNGDIDGEVINDYANQNIKVITRLRDQTNEGRAYLIKTAEAIIKQVHKPINPAPLLASALSNARNFKELNAAKYQIEVQIKMINDYADALRAKTHELKFLHSHLAVRILNKLRAIKNKLS